MLLNTINLFPQCLLSYAIFSLWQKHEMQRKDIARLKIIECTFQNTTNTKFKIPLFMYTYLH